MDHAATIKQLQVADKAKTLLDNTIQDHIRAKAQAEAEKVLTPSSHLGQHSNL